MIASPASPRPPGGPSGGVGSALAAADFDGDGCADLAIGAPGEDQDGLFDVGVAHVVWGSPEGLVPVAGSPTAQTVRHEELVLSSHRNHGDGLGSALAAGDFDADGAADLVVGIPELAELAGNGNDGAFTLLFGNLGGELGGIRFLTRWAPADGAAIENRFGHALAAGRLDGERRIRRGAPPSTSGWSRLAVIASSRQSVARRFLIVEPALEGPS